MQHQQQPATSATVTTVPAADVAAYTLTAEQFATLNGIKRKSLEARVSRTGSYFGVRPLKLANRRTLWPATAVTA